MKERPSQASHSSPPPGEDPGWAARAADCVRLARAELIESILPFWWRSIDPRNGGVFNCWNNAGTRLLSRDKFTWSQGRFLWLWSRIAALASRGMLPVDPGPYLDHADKTAAFLESHAFLDDGRCALLLFEDGVAKELEPGMGLAPSIYADCFVAMGLAEYAGVRGQRKAFDRAWALAAEIRRRIGAGRVPTHPYPVPEGYESHGLAMILLNLALVMEDGSRNLGDPRSGAAREIVMEAAGRMVARFYLPGGRIAEMRRGDGVPHDDRLLDRHINPGHALEGTWMLVEAGLRSGRNDWVERALEATGFALEHGWDAMHGGLLLQADFAGGPPKGLMGDSRYEAAVVANWDSKLWWVHSEALYATLQAFQRGAGAAMGAWVDRIREYCFRIFPNPDRSVGEWIQIRDRAGRPIERVVALPVKDPYHIARNLLQILELGTGG